MLLKFVLYLHQCAPILKRLFCHERVLVIFQVCLFYCEVKLNPPESTNSTFPFNLISIPMALSYFLTLSSIIRSLLRQLVNYNLGENRVESQVIFGRLDQHCQTKPFEFFQSFVITFISWKSKIWKFLTYLEKRNGIASSKLMVLTRYLVKCLKKILIFFNLT